MVEFKHLVIWIILSFSIGILGIYNTAQRSGTSEVNKQVALEHYKKEKQCLVEALWHEARGEGVNGIRSVASVIKNRVNTHGFPGDYCGVIHQKGQFTYKGHSRKPLEVPESCPDKEVMQLVHSIADEALKGELKSPVKGDVLWYHTKQIKPRWTKKLKLVQVIGKHKFYTT